MGPTQPGELWMHYEVHDSSDTRLKLLATTSVFRPRSPTLVDLGRSAYVRLSPVGSHAFAGGENSPSN